MKWDANRGRFVAIMTLLVVCAVFLSVRLVYMFVADSKRFPIQTVKISASYQHLTRSELERILSPYLSESFLTLSVKQLQVKLQALDWVDSVDIKRIWPDTLKITVIEKKPIAFWNRALLTHDAELFHAGKNKITEALPQLTGPDNQHQYVLQIYKKLSKLLATYGLNAASLRLRDNQAWELSLSNGVKIQLGKQDIVPRLERFCRAYPVVFADKPEQLSRVDLRYSRGMAVQWKQQTER